MLYSTYRPQTFKEVVGQENNILTLKEQCKTKKFDSAYLLQATGEQERRPLHVSLQEQYAVRPQVKTVPAINAKTAGRFWKEKH